MKTERNKKLKLNKQTVSTLNYTMMKKIKGGFMNIDTTFTATIGWPRTCWCTANTELFSCCAGDCGTPGCPV